MTIKTFCLVLILALFQTRMLAGEFSLSAGGNHSWLVYKDSELPYENKFRPSYSFGANAILLSDGVNLSAGLRLFDVGRYDSQEGYDATVSHVYLSAPIRVGYELFDGLVPFLNVEPGILLHAGATVSTPDGRNGTSFTNEMNMFNLFAGLGLKYIFTVDGNKLSVAGQFNAGLLRVSKDEQFDVTPTGSRGWLDWRTREIVVYFEYYFGG